MEIERYYSERYKGYLKVIFHDSTTNPSLEDEEVIYEVACDWDIHADYVPWDCFPNSQSAYEYFESVKENI